jgi:DNA-binding MarR family transcriptional regulator
MLGAIDRCEDDPPTLSDLSGDALLSVQNVSRMVAAMEADGLVERYTRTGMGRAVFVRTTDAGRRVLDEAIDRATRFTARFLAGFSETEIGVLQGAFDRMIDNLEAFERELCEERACAANPQGRGENQNGNER